jgi:hypothetical protein
VRADPVFGQSVISFADSLQPLDRDFFAVLKAADRPMFRIHCQGSPKEKLDKPLAIQFFVCAWEMFGPDALEMAESVYFDDPDRTPEIEIKPFGTLSSTNGNCIRRIDHRKREGRPTHINEAGNNEISSALYDHLAGHLSAEDSIPGQTQDGSQYHKNGSQFSEVNQFQWCA